MTFQAENWKVWTFLPKYCFHSFFSSSFDVKKGWAARISDLFESLIKSETTHFKLFEVVFFLLVVLSPPVHDGSSIVSSKLTDEASFHCDEKFSIPRVLKKLHPFFAPLEHHQHSCAIAIPIISHRITNPSRRKNYRVKEFKRNENEEKSLFLSHFYRFASAPSLPFRIIKSSEKRIVRPAIFAGVERQAQEFYYPSTTHSLTAKEKVMKKFARSVLKCV